MVLGLFLFNTLICLAILYIFFLLGQEGKWDSLLSSSFECGFSSYFYSRFSFSIHYFLVGLIFLFLDLELCFVMPFFNECLTTFLVSKWLNILLMVLLVGLLHEWVEGKLDWKF